MNFIFAPNMILILKYIKDPEGFWRQKILCVELDVDDLLSSKAVNSNSMDNDTING